jgi:hypothetical protein
LIPVDHAHAPLNAGRDAFRPAATVATCRLGLARLSKIVCRFSSRGIVPRSRRIGEPLALAGRRELGYDHRVVELGNGVEDLAHEGRRRRVVNESIGAVSPAAVTLYSGRP